MEEPCVGKRSIIKVWDMFMIAIEVHPTRRSMSATCFSKASFMERSLKNDKTRGTDK